jgi:hypothetical protein
MEILSKSYNALSPFLGKDTSWKELLLLWGRGRVVFASVSQFYFYF